MKAVPVPTEYHEQVTLVREWWARFRHRWPGVLLYAIPNAGGLSGGFKANVVRVQRLLAAGMIPGVPDLHVACPSWDTQHERILHGLYVDMKRTRGGRVDPQQLEIHGLLQRAGYTVVVAKGWEPAAAAIEQYLNVARQFRLLPMPL